MKEVKICPECNKPYILYSILGQADNVAQSSDVYGTPIYFDKKKYIGFKCNCGAVIIEPQ